MSETVVFEMPLLLGTSSTGKPKMWSICVVEIDDGYKLKASAGYVGHKITDTYSSFIKGKNIGRSNETTPLEQAKSEAASKWQKKKDENYREEGDSEEAPTQNLRPMLAHKYKDRKHDVSWPAAAQPKLNGVRCLAKRVGEEEIEYTSRSGKKYTTLEHLTPALLEMLHVGQIVDGEIYLHGVPLQDITSAVKRAKTDNPLTKTLQYWIYDVVDEETSFFDRFIESLLYQDDKVRLTPTVIVNNEAEFLQCHDRFKIAGFEGTMIRNLESKYVLDHRSADLQKHKDFVDGEFVIVGGKEAQGEDEGTVVYTCVTESGKTFDVRPEGTREERREMFLNLANDLGKHLTVRYQELTKDGIPQFPVGVVVRDYE